MNWELMGWYALAAVALYIAIIHPYVVSYRRKKSPSYNAKCTVREDARYARAAARRRQQQAAQRRRALEWAKANPDDDVAKALLASHQSAPSAPTTSSTPVLTIEVDPTDPTALLREDQRSTDEYDAWSARLKAQRIQLLELAIQHPNTPESQRCLNENRVELQQKLTWAKGAEKDEVETTIARIQAALKSVNASA